MVSRERLERVSLTMHARVVLEREKREKIYLHIEERHGFHDLLPRVHVCLLQHHMTLLYLVQQKQLVQHFDSHSTGLRDIIYYRIGTALAIVVRGGGNGIAVGGQGQGQRL